MILMAATADSSFFAHTKNNSSGRRYHIAKSDWTGECGNPILNEDRAMPADAVPHELRCRGNGCRDRWPT